MIELQSNSLHFSKHIAVKYNISRKSANLPALIFLKLFGIRVVNKITNISRLESINNYFKLNLALYFKMISQLESILNHSKKSLKTALYNESHRLVSNLQKNANNFIEQGSYKIANNVMNVILSEAKNLLIANHHETLHFVQGDKMRYFTTTSRHKDLLSIVNDINRLSFPQAERVGNPSFTERFSPQASRRGDRTSRNDRQSRTYVAMYSINKSLYNETFRRTFVGQASRLSQNASQSDNPTTSRRTPFKMGMDDFYFHNQRKIEQEFEEIKKTVVETKEAIEERLTSTNLLGVMDFKKHFDINRISDQVYKMIDHKLKIEKERRGYL